MTFEEYKKNILLNELNYVKTYNIKNVVYDLYDSRKLDSELLNVIDTLMEKNKYEIPSEENISKYENFYVDEDNNEDNEDNENEENEEACGHGFDPRRRFKFQN